MIDIHTHVFNLGYIPIRGVLESRGVSSWIAKPLTAILEGAIERDESLPLARILGAFHPSGDSTTGASLSLRTEGAELAFILAHDSSDAFIEAHANDIEEAYRELEREDAANALHMRESAVTALGRQRAEALQALSLGGLRRKLWELFKRLALKIARVAAVLDWFLMLLSRESELVRVLEQAWPKAELFVHHMMDMDSHYPPGEALYPFFSLQLRRMRRLAEGSGGHVLGFVAFDPFRRNGVDIVREALHRGCAGVKFYPPSGYRPIGNTVHDMRLSGQDPMIVNGRNLELFRLCVQLDAPIFAHCSPGGMEKRPSEGWGCLSDPRGWESVLQQDGLRALRLCLGHAGGDDEWTSPLTNPKPAACGQYFLPKVVELCAQYPNVYFEFGHVDAVFDPMHRGYFTERLVAAFRQHDILASKCMYGSDWHLLMREPGYERFDDAYREIFRGHPVLSAHEKAFFRDNALAYLNLPVYLERNAGSITQREAVYLQSLLDTVT